jgi:predicted amidohydrolase YtcJ
VTTNQPSILLHSAELSFGARLADVRIQHGLIREIGSGLRAHSGELGIDANGHALLPGLHDHHIHLQALASTLNTAGCDLGTTHDDAALAAQLQLAVAAGDDDWLRVTGYHEGIAGDIDRDWLDQHVTQRPVRLQHRSGRLWIFNSRALALLGEHEPAAPLERQGGRATGRLYDGDAWLRTRLHSQRPSLLAASRRLASYGVTGITDVTHTNTRGDYDYFSQCQRRGELLQRVTMMGDATLDAMRPGATITPGATKIHLHEHELPDFAVLCTTISRSHRANRPVAVHCVTVTELAFTLAALATAGKLPGDRIEHAGMVSDEWLQPLLSSGVTVVTQPNFIAERGERYLATVPATEHGDLYRARSLVAAGVPLAAGTDAPFGDCNPWRAMQAAVERRTASGQMLGAAEALTHEAACELFLGAPAAPGASPQVVAVAQPADLCLVDRDWATARRDLAQVVADLTLCSGTIIWNSLAAGTHANTTSTHRRHSRENPRHALAL